MIVLIYIGPLVAGHWIFGKKSNTGITHTGSLLSSSVHLRKGDIGRAWWLKPVIPAL